MKKVAVITHRRSEDTLGALLRVIDICNRHSVEVVIPRSEIDKYPMDVPDSGVSVLPVLDESGAEACIALGGDGTIMRAFDSFPDMRTPVFGVNYGRVGFLSAVEPDAIDAGITAVIQEDCEIFPLSLIELELDGYRHLALNDVVVHKPDGGSIIRLGYSIGEVDMSSLSCDGMVVATATGSTAYNLATGGPLLSLKLGAMVITAIAPHTLCSRPLVAAPEDEVTIRNESISAAAAVYIDGRNCGEIAPGDRVVTGLSSMKAQLLQMKGANFYRKLRDKFIMPNR